MSDCESQRRVLAYFNHFIANSAKFIQDFSTNCETKLAKIARKIAKIETDLQILESKLGIRNKMLT